MATQLKAVIFDVDGTLAETERNGHRIAFNRAFLDAGLDWNWDEALYGKLLAVTDGKERIRYFLTDFNSDFKYDGDMDQFIVDLHVSKNKHYVDLIEKPSHFSTSRHKAHDEWTPMRRFAHGYCYDYSTC